MHLVNYSFPANRIESSLRGEQEGKGKLSNLFIGTLNETHLRNFDSSMNILRLWIFMAGKWNCGYDIRASLIFELSIWGHYENSTELTHCVEYLWDTFIFSLLYITKVIDFVIYMCGIKSYSSRFIENAICISNEQAIYVWMEQHYFTLFLFTFCEFHVYTCTYVLLLVPFLLVLTQYFYWVIKYWLT